MRGVMAVVRVLLVVLVVGVIANCGDDPTAPERAVRNQAPIAFATAGDGNGLSITTDKDDYAPGDTVWFTGAGWTPEDSVDIVLVDDPTGDSHQWTVGISADGTFRDSTYVVDVNDVGVTFTLTATSRGNPLQTLTVNFKDGNVRAAAAPAGVTFTLVRKTYTAASCGGTESTLSPDVVVNNAFNTVATAGNPGQPVSVKLIAPATSTQGAPFTAWSSTSTFSVVGGDPKVICVAGASGNLDFLATFDAQPDLELVKSTTGAFTSGGTGTFAIEVKNTGTATASGPSDNRITVTDVIPPGLTPPASLAPANWACDISGQTITCRLAAGQSIAPGASRTFNIPVGVTSGACPSIVNSATVSGGNEPAGKVDAKNTGSTGTVNVGNCNTGPTAEAGGPYEGNEGSAIALSGASAGGTATPLSYKWNYAAVSGVDAGTTCSFSPSDTSLNPSITCDDDGTFEVTLTVTDHDNLSASDKATVTVSNLNPVAVPGGPYSGDEGSSIPLAGSGTDAGTHDNIASYAWTVDFTGIDDDGTCTITNATSANASVKCTDDGSFKVALTVTDDDGGTSTKVEAGLTVNNVKPTADAGGTYSGDEGEAIALAGSGDDAGANDVPDLTYKWTVTTTGIDTGGDCTFDDDTKADAKVTCTDDSGAGTFSLQLVVDDDDGGTSTASTTTVKVANKKPELQSFTLADGSAIPATVIIGATLNLKVVFTDAGSNDTHEAKVDCGAGYGTAATATSPVTPSCTLSSVGSKTLQVKITDDDGGYAVASATVGVFYGFEGLFAPVDRPNTMNVSKAGQGIPLKWRLTDFSGAPILDFTAAALGVAVTMLPCTTSATTDQIEEYAGNSGLQNLGDGYYQFNWKTPSNYANSCRAIGLNLGEGTTRGPLAFFNFKK